ncbi:hypothetical protein GCM10018962_36490 [Dactylosporangium matsuzakiense]|uniref:Uncharacterized protein n=1 Tax=Dactylosporangium matsuzakiense TaxID=53360 RepID=A0A9W6L031_9ACTN|nr:hypothetical protein GCM10017581_103260 [Dactylosporangium matsuzakiense]
MHRDFAAVEIDPVPLQAEQFAAAAGQGVHLAGSDVGDEVAAQDVAVVAQRGLGDVAFPLGEPGLELRGEAAVGGQVGAGEGLPGRGLGGQGVLLTEEPLAFICQRLPSEVGGRSMVNCQRT